MGLKKIFKGIGKVVKKAVPAVGKFLSPLGPIVSAVGSVAGPLLAGKSQEKGIASANEANVKLAEENRAFEERMSGTAVQRQVQDYQAAGLNPMLAAGGNGASTPNVSAPTVESTKQSRLAAVSGALSAKMQLEQINNMRQQNRLIGAQADMAGIEARMKAWEEPYGAFMADTKVKQMGQQYDTLAAQLKGILQRNDIDFETLKQGRLTTKQQELLNPVMEQIARMDMRAKQLGMKGLENINAFEKDTDGMANWVKFLLGIFREVK